MLGHEVYEALRDAARVRVHQPPPGHLGRGIREFNKQIG
jgi:hypothetical protein